MRVLLRWAGASVRPVTSADDAVIKTEKTIARDAASKSTEAKKSLNVVRVPSASATPAAPAAQAAAITLAALDDAHRLDVAAAVQRLGGDAALYQRIARNYCADLSLQSARLATLSVSASSADVLAFLHTLKGTSATVGAVRLARLLAEVEQRIKQVGQTQPLAAAHQVPDWVDGVCAEIRHTERALRCALENTAPAAPPISDNRQSSSTTVPAAIAPTDSQALIESLRRWQPGLRRLMALLAACDMDAVLLHDEMMQDARVAALAEWQPLHQAMSVLDFEQAQGAVRHLLTARPAP